MCRGGDDQRGSPARGSAVGGQGGSSDERLEQFQAATHELNEAMRIAEHWRLRNSDAEEVLRRVANAREIVIGLAMEEDW